jgi:DNA-directed RNA polymerase beta' subunit
MYGDIETTRGVSASIMVGKPIQTGTGMCDLYYQQP